MGIEAFVDSHWLQWNAAPNYLGIGPPYLTDCPPMWFIGGRHVPQGARPLIVLSLEPLVAWHYDRQRKYATAGLDAYRRWQLDYFDVFPTPELAGPEPQKYWRTIFELVAGFVDSSSGFDWRTFRDAYVELPFVALHAPQHDGRAFRNAADKLEELLFERLRLLDASWPRAVFLCVGRAGAEALRPAPGTTDEPLEMPAWAWARRERLGSAFFGRPIVRRSVSIGSGKVITVFVRRAPFGNGHQPTHEGLRVLGRVLRELDSEAPDTDREVP